MKYFKDWLQWTLQLFLEIWQYPDVLDPDNPPFFKSKRHYSFLFLADIQVFQSRPNYTEVPFCIIFYMLFFSLKVLNFTLNVLTYFSLSGLIFAAWKIPNVLRRIVTKIPNIPKIGQKSSRINPHENQSGYVYFTENCKTKQAPKQPLFNFGSWKLWINSLI